jgi:hypothetical protein
MFFLSGPMPSPRALFHRSSMKLLGQLNRKACSLCVYLTFSKRFPNARLLQYVAGLGRATWRTMWFSPYLIEKSVKHKANRVVAITVKE